MAIRVTVSSGGSAVGSSTGLLSPVSYKDAKTSPRWASTHGAMSSPRCRRYDSRQCLEGRHRDDRFAQRHGQPLHRRDADAQTGERARAGGHGKEVDSRERQAGLRQQIDQLAGKARGVRDRRVTGGLGEDLMIPDQGHAPGPSGGVECEHNHREKANGLNVILAATTLRQHFVPALMTSPAFSEPAGATPAMRQYFDAKRQHRDAIVFFRMGDFYEMFYEDALTAARALELTLTSRSKDASGGAIPMCGVPHHAVDTYIARLVRKGFRVAVCEQVEDPRKVKGLVRREVVRVVSPGTLTDSSYLEAREPALIVALAPSVDGHGIGAALLDLSTGEFTTAEYAGDAGRQALVDELHILQPRELLLPEAAGSPAGLLGDVELAARVTLVDGWAFDFEPARRCLIDQLQAHSLDGYGLEPHPAAVRAAGAMVHYLRETQKADLAHVRAIGYRTGADCLSIDPITMRNLEVIASSAGTRAGSLLHEIDRTVTPMGGRLLRGWLLRPLVAIERIQDRLDAVEEFAFRTTERAKVRDTLKAVHDMERLVGRAALGTAGPRDLVSLASVDGRGAAHRAAAG